MVTSIFVESSWMSSNFYTMQQHNMFNSIFRLSVTLAKYQNSVNFDPIFLRVIAAPTLPHPHITLEGGDNSNSKIDPTRS